MFSNTMIQQSGSGVLGLGTIEQLYFDVNGSVTWRTAPSMALINSLLQLVRLCSQSLMQE